MIAQKKTLKDIRKERKEAKTNKKISRSDKRKASMNVSSAKKIINTLTFGRTSESVSARLRREIMVILLRFMNGNTMEGFITHTK